MPSGPIHALHTISPVESDVKDSSWRPWGEEQALKRVGPTIKKDCRIFVFQPREVRGIFRTTRSPQML